MNNWKEYFMWICLLSNVLEGLSVNYILWCMIDEGLQELFLTLKNSLQLSKKFGVSQPKIKV